MPKALCPNQRVFLSLSFPSCRPITLSLSFLQSSPFLSLSLSLSLTLTLYFFPPAPSLPSLSRVFLLSGLVNAELGYKSKQPDKNISSIQKCFPSTPSHQAENFTSGHQELVTNPYTGYRSMGR